MFDNEKKIESSIQVMLIVLCIFLIGLSFCDSNQPTIITRFDTNEISTEYHVGSSSIFPSIDPDIIEDVNLTTV